VSIENNILCGFHAVEAALAANHVKELFIESHRTDMRMRRLIAAANAAKVPIRTTNKSELDQMSDGVRHQGVIARGAQILVRNGLIRYLKNVDCPLVLILDGFNDPANFGNCLRSGAAIGVDAIVIPKHRGCGLTSTAIRVAAGGATSVAIFEEGNWGPLLESMKALGLWLMGLDERANIDFYEVDLSVPVALVVGSEDKGLRQLTRRRCDQLVRIPTSEKLSSLNAATAAGVAMFEAHRQRRG
jgi:23S rRNA (guanosine2251-2'-O)-methyltransferase